MHREQNGYPVLGGAWTWRHPVRQHGRTLGGDSEAVAAAAGQRRPGEEKAKVAKLLNQPGSFGGSFVLRKLAS